MKFGALYIQPKIPEISVRNQWNGKHHFGSIRPEYLGPPLKVVHFDLAVISVGRTEMSLSIDWTKLLSPAPLFWILLTNMLTRTITEHEVAWVGSVECTVILGTWNLRNFKPEFLLNGSRPWIPSFLLGLETIFWPIGSKALVIFFLKLVC